MKINNWYYLVTLLTLREDIDALRICNLSTSIVYVGRFAEFSL